MDKLKIEFELSNKFLESEYDNYSLYLPYYRASIAGSSVALVYDKEDEQLYLGYVRNACTMRARSEYSKEYDEKYADLVGEYIGEFIRAYDIIGIGVDLVAELDFDKSKLNIVEYC